MTTSTSIRGAGLTVALVVLLAGAPAGADTWDPDAENSPDAAPESVTADTPDAPGAGRRPTIDPFRALIAPPEPPPVTLVHTPVVVPPPRPVVPPAPVAFRVEAIAGDPGQYMAVLEYAGQTYIVTPGMKVPETGPAAFEVKIITADAVEVYDPKVKRLIQKPL